MYSLPSGLLYAGWKKTSTVTETPDEILVTICLIDFDKDN